MPAPAWRAKQPVTRVVFSDWNLSPQVSDEAFAAKVPDGYERLMLRRYATIEDKSVTETVPTETAKPPRAPPKRP